ncbi:MAG: NRDE family protein [Pseudomonadota bacterium]
MCLILLACYAHPDYPLIIAANRDEAYVRMAAPAAFWGDHPHLHAGRDLEKSGTWLGITRTGRIAAVTNYRAGYTPKDAPRSRGELVSQFLLGNDNTVGYLGQVAAHGDEYNGFSLIAGDLDALYFVSNRGAGIERISPGVHGLSNHLLDTPWPKVERGKRALQNLLAADEAALVAGLFDFLAERTTAGDQALPDTGVGVQRERELSPAFIGGERYGTRASTLVLVRNNGEVLFRERSFGAGGGALGEACSRFTLEKTAGPLRAACTLS